MEVKILTDAFYNNIRYVRLGTGSKAIFVLLGGPGDMIKNERAENYGMLFTDLIEMGYSIYVVSRGNNLKIGRTLYDMGKDINDIITKHFDGCIEAVIGYSYGGFVTQQLAGNFAASSKKYITLGTTYYMSDDAEHIDSRMTEHVMKKDFLEAFRKVPELVFTDPEQIEQLNRFVGQNPEGMFRSMYYCDYPNFFSDMEIENNALHKLNHKEVVERITNPFMIIGGTKDKYFSKEDMVKTATLVPHSELVLLDGKGHGELLTLDTVSKITDFIHKN